MGENKAAITYIKGLQIKKHIPDEILDNVKLSVKEAGHEWNDDLIERCCLSVNSKYIACVLECDEVSFSHKGYLFGFWWDEMKSEYAFSWSKKHLHL
jgi:hypothetical protein